MWGGGVRVRVCGKDMRMYVCVCVCEDVYKRVGESNIEELSCKYCQVHTYM